MYCHRDRVWLLSLLFVELLPNTHEIYFLVEVVQNYRLSRSQVRNRTKIYLKIMQPKVSWEQGKGRQKCSLQGVSAGVRACVRACVQFRIQDTSL